SPTGRLRVRDHVMSIRMHCRSCGTAFVTSDDLVGRRVLCPKCGARQNVPDPALHVPAAVAAMPATMWEETETPAPSIFVANEAPRRPGWYIALGLGVLLVLAVAAGALVVAWPKIDRWWHPIPPDPVEVAANA